MGLLRTTRNTILLYDKNNKELIGLLLVFIIRESSMNKSMNVGHGVLCQTFGTGKWILSSRSQLLASQNLMVTQRNPYATWFFRLIVRNRTQFTNHFFMQNAIEMFSHRSAIQMDYLRNIVVGHRYHFLYLVLGWYVNSFV